MTPPVVRFDIVPVGYFQARRDVVGVSEAEMAEMENHAMPTARYGQILERLLNESVKLNDMTPEGRC